MGRMREVGVSSCTAREAHDERPVEAASEVFGAGVRSVMNGEHPGNGLHECAGLSVELFQLGRRDAGPPTDEYDMDNGWCGHTPSMHQPILTRPAP